MAVLVVSEKKHLALLEERLTLLENRLNNLHQRTKEIGEILPKALCHSTDQEALQEALQTPIEKCVKELVRQDPQSFFKVFAPIVIPLLRKVLATSRKPMVTALQACQSRLKYFEQYLENMDQALVAHQAQLEKLSSHLSETPVDKKLATQKSQLDEIVYQVNHLKGSTQSFQERWQNQIEELNQSFDKLERTLVEQYTQGLAFDQRIQSVEKHLATFSSLNQIEQYLDHLEKAHVSQQLQLDQFSGQVSALEQAYRPLQEAWQTQVSQGSHLEKYLDNLDHAMVDHATQLTELNKQIVILKEWIGPLQQALSTQNDHVADFEKYIDNLEKIQVNHHFQLSQLEEQLALLKETFKPFRESLHVHQTQLDTMEQSIESLEKIRVSQHFELSELDKKINQFHQTLKPLETTLQTHQKQFSDVDQHLNNLEQSQLNQHMKLSNFGKQVDIIENNLTHHQKQLHTLDKQLYDTLQVQQTHLDQVSKQITEFDHLNKGQTTKLKKHLKEITSRYQALENRINDPQQRAADIASILPDAIKQAAEQMTSELTAQVNIPVSCQISPLRSQQDEKTEESSSATREEILAQSMQRPVEICIQQAIQKDVRPFANALFPLIGPTIRKSIAEAFKDLVQRINMMLGQSIFSKQGIVWRIQAWRTGQSFAEIVLSHTLAYRVEQAFLIHRHSGLLILHAHLEGIDIGDSDAVSAMFSAIQDFVRDSFSANKEEELESVEVGDFTVWIERGPYAALACVIRGTAPRHFRQLMQEQVEAIHARCGPLIEQFDGDNAALLYCKPMLDHTLRTELKSAARPRWMTPQLASILGGLALIGGVSGYIHFGYQARLQNYIHALQETKGIVVVSSEYQDGQWVIHGLRDPLAESPRNIAQRFQLDEAEVVFKEKPYLDLDPHFVERRIHQWLKPPNTIQLVFVGNVLHLKGHANQSWIDKMNERIGSLVGVGEINVEALVNTDAQFQAYLKVLKDIPGIMLVSSGVKNGQRFVTGMRDPIAEDPIELARRMQLSDIIATWRPYQDMTPQLVEKRVVKKIVPPSTVSVRIQGDILHFRGHASSEWINKALETVRTIAGINRIVTDELVDTDRFLLSQAKRHFANLNISLAVHKRVLQVTGEVDSTTFRKAHEQLQSFKKIQSELVNIDTQNLIDGGSEILKLVQEIEQTRIYFSEEIGWIGNQDKKLANLLKSVQRVITLSQKLQQGVRFQLIGNTDGVGTELYNRELSARRAQVVFDWLMSQKIRKDMIMIVSPVVPRFGESEPNSQDRNVSFKVIGEVEVKPDLKSEHP